MADDKPSKKVSSTSSAGNLPQANPLSKKLERILENRLEDERDTVEALKVLSEFLPTNTLHARRNLRSDLERRGLLLSEEFRDQLGLLVTQVQNVQVRVCRIDLLHTIVFIFLLLINRLKSEQ